VLDCTDPENAMHNILSKFTLAAVSALTLAGCVSEPRYGEPRYADQQRYDSRQDDYRSDDGRYRDERCDSCGRIERIDQVSVGDNRVGGGTVLGAIIGGALGNTVGSGDGRRAATAAGAIAGGVIGHEVEKNQRDQRSGYRIEVRLDDGRFGQITQLQNPGLRVGDRVIIRNERVYALR